MLIDWTITDADILRAAENVVNNYGSEYAYINQGECLYFEEDGTPGCFFGAVLHEFKLTCDVVMGIENVLTMFFPNSSTKLRSAAGKAQELNDIGYNWGKVYETFRDEYNAFI